MLSMPKPCRMASVCGCNVLARAYHVERSLRIGLLGYWFISSVFLRIVLLLVLLFVIKPFRIRYLLYQTHTTRTLRVNNEHMRQLSGSMHHTSPSYLIQCTTQGPPLMLHHTMHHTMSIEAPHKALSDSTP